ncbi:MAG: hypothetical protein PHE84_01250 [bacterium]|nr:hypothetical protein [bacterium]
MESQDIYIGALKDILSILPMNGEVAGLDLPWPKNIVDWISGREFLNISTIWKYTTHLVILRDFHELLCPYCNKEEKLVMTADEFRAQVLLEHNQCPKCKATKLDLYKAGLIKGYNEMVGAAGMRSGKTAIASYESTFRLQEMIRLFAEGGSLQAYYGLLPGQDVEFAFLAAAVEQSKDTVWSAFKKRMQYSPWFQKLIEALKAREAAEGLEAGSLVKETGSRLDFNGWGLHFVNLSKNSATAAGRTRAGVAIDELSRFDLTDSKFSADDVYDVHNTSMSTLWLKNEEKIRAGEWPRFWPVMMSIGAPYMRRDKIMTLIDEDSKKLPRMFTYRKATWELNPDFRKDGEFIKDRYRVDPVQAERDYGANPPGAANAAFNPDIVEACVDRGRRPILAYRVIETRDTVKDLLLHYLRLRFTTCQADKMTPRYIHCDPGRSDCAFGMAILHKEPVPEGDWRFIEDAVVMIKARRERVGNESIIWQVHFPSVTNFILELDKLIYIHTISFDRWQPAHFLDTLRDHRIRAIQYSVTRAAYIDFKNDLEAFRVSLLTDDEGGGAKKALAEVKELNDTGTHMTPVESDDMIQCVVGAHHHAKWAEEDMLKYSGGRHQKRLHPQNFNTVPFHRRPGKFIHFRRY